MGGPAVTVCIVTSRRATLLDACLASLEAQVSAPEFEVLVCADDDPTVAAVVHRRFPEARVCEVDRAQAGAGRNLLIEQARGELLLFLDDDVTAHPDMLARLAELAAAHPDVDVFGGPNDTPPGSGRFQTVQGAVLASIVGSGPVRRRYGAHPAGPADERFFTLCNLAVRRRSMRPFANDLVCAEENEVLCAMSRSGAKMHYDPTLVAYHERRSTLSSFGRQMHKYGRGRGQLVARRPGTLRPAHVAPSALLAYLAASPVLALLLGPVAAVPLVAYAGAVGANAVWVAGTLQRPSEVAPAAFLLATVHACYGTGVVRGLVERKEAVAAPEALGWTGPQGAQDARARNTT